MTPIEQLAVAMAAIWGIIEVVKYAFPEIPARLIPLLGLLLGAAFAAYLAVTTGTGWLSLIAAAVVAAQGAAGLHGNRKTLSGE